MTERVRVPKRPDSADSFLRNTRIGALLALLLLAGGVASDFLDGAFWVDHAMITALVGSLLVVAISAGVFNELVERRNRQRWSVLAQYVMLELVQTARLAWTGLLELAEPIRAQPGAPIDLTAGRELVADQAQLHERMTDVVHDPPRREILQRAIAAMARRCDEVLGRWASVMLSATAYTEVIDRHVELYARIVWADGLLGHNEPLDDDLHRRLLSQANPAVELQSDFNHATLSDMIVSIVTLAESLDRLTLGLAMHLVPMDWWTARSYDSSTAPSGG